jgi:ribosomal protein L40E
MVELIVLIGMVAGLVQFCYILAWWGNGQLKSGEAAVLFFMDVLLLAVLVKDPSYGVKAVVALLLFAPYFGVFFMYKTSGLKDLYLEEIEKYKQTIDHDPRNLAARELLAKTLYKMGDTQTAMDELRILIGMNPEDENMKYLLRQWETEKQEIQTGIVVCPHCGAENDSRRTWCKKCEKPIFAYKPASAAGKLGVRGFLAVFGSIATIIMAFRFLPTEWALTTVLCAFLALVGWAMRSDKQGNN